METNFQKNRIEALKDKLAGLMPREILEQVSKTGQNLKNCTTLNKDFDKLFAEYDFLVEQMGEEDFLEKNKIYLENIAFISNFNARDLSEKKIFLFLLNLESIQGKTELKQKLLEMQISELSAESYILLQNSLSTFLKNKKRNELTKEKRDAVDEYVGTNYLGVQFNIEWITALSEIKLKLESLGIIKDNKFVRMMTKKEAEFCEKILDVSAWTQENFFGKWIIPASKEQEKKPIIDMVFDELDTEKTSEEQRSKNVDCTNKKQRQFCEKAGIDFDFDQFDENKRTLVLYYRANIDGKRFALMAETARRYISEEYSRVFNDLVIVSRHSYKFPTKFCKKIKYKDINKEDFKNTCSIYANTVHLEHGTPFEFEMGSPPILGIAIEMDNSKVAERERGKDYIPLNLHLDYCGEKMRGHAKDFMPNSMLKELIRAIQELENVIIED